MIEKARRHFTQARHLHESDPADWEKLQDVEMHLGRSTDARKIGDWKSALREADAAIAAGADSSQLVNSSSLACAFFLSSVGKWKWFYIVDSC